MRISVKQKFLVLSLLSVICILVLGYSGYSNAKLIKKAEKEIIEAYTASLYQANYDGSQDAVKLSVDVYYLSNLSGKKENLKQALDQFNDHLSEYKTAIKNLTLLDMSEEIKKDISNLEKLSEDFIVKAQAVIDNPNSQDFITAFYSAFTIIDQLNYKLVDSMGEVIVRMNKDAETITNKAIDSLTTTALFTILFALLVPIFTFKNILYPQGKITHVMFEILNGRLNVEIPYLDRNDEIGEMAAALDKFKLNTIENKEFERKTKEQEEKSQLEKQSELNAISSDFERSIKGIADIVASSVTELNVTAKELGDLSNHTSQDSKQLGSLFSLTYNNINDTAKAINEFTSAINEISKQVNNSSVYANKATVQADNISAVISDLSNKANAITSIIDLIHGITSQIDLLALNATIEAARAGESGKGFAVVANEVKALATQTSKATDQINIQISAIQQSTNKVVDGIKEITDSVKTINQNSASIASAVEEQNVTASYIAENVSKVAEMSNNVNNSISNVGKAANNSTSSIGQMMQATEDLLKQASLMQTEVNKFLQNLKK
jgi:methyl-accepting chemotaxis protein